MSSKHNHDMMPIGSTKYLLALALIPLIIFAACKKDDTEEKQRERIESYITNSLRAEVDVRDGVYYVPREIDTTIPENLRKYIKAGDVVTFEYVANVMGGSIFATSDDILAVENQIPSTSIGAVVVGSGQLIAGLDIGLRRMALNDFGILIFPYTLGYGESNLGFVPPLSPLMFQVLITSINNQQ